MSQVAADGPQLVVMKSITGTKHVCRFFTSMSLKRRENKPTVHVHEPAQHTDTAGHQLVTTADLSAAIEPDVSPREPVETKDGAQREGTSNVQLPDVPVH